MKDEVKKPECEEIVLAKGSKYQIELNYYTTTKDTHSRILRGIIKEIENIQKEVEILKIKIDGNVL